jgi:RNA ligase (TIGR02306 family)
MSTIRIEVVSVASVEPHPNADRLEIARIGGTQVVVGKGTFAAGDLGIYFPPGILIPDTVSVPLGVSAYLKHATYPGHFNSTACRVGACRLRGTPSYGFLVSAKDPDVLALMPGNDGYSPAIGDDLTLEFGGVKYEPPAPRCPNGSTRNFFADAAPDQDDFHRYTDIEHYWRYQNVLQPGELVRITEKLHGTNVRFGFLRSEISGEFEFMVGSRKRNLKPVQSNGYVPIYWRMLSDPIKAILVEASLTCRPNAGI